MMKIEAGKKYLQRNGKIVGPFVQHERSGMWKLETAAQAYDYWYPTGVFYSDGESVNDLMSIHVEPPKSVAPDVIWVNEWTSGFSGLFFENAQDAARQTRPPCTEFLITHKYIRVPT